MLVLESLRWLAGLPRLARVGLIWLVGALAADVLLHIGFDHGVVQPGLEAVEQAAHVAVLVGMVLLYLGVVTDGVGRRLRKSTRPQKGVK